MGTNSRTICVPALHILSVCLVISNRAMAEGMPLNMAYQADMGHGLPMGHPSMGGERPMFVPDRGGGAIAQGPMPQQQPQMQQPQMQHPQQQGPMDRQSMVPFAQVKGNEPINMGADGTAMSIDDVTMMQRQQRAMAAYRQQQAAQYQQQMQQQQQQQQQEAMKKSVQSLVKDEVKGNMMIAGALVFGAGMIYIMFQLQNNSRGPGIL